MDELMLDGNAVAGLLQELFAVEMTTAIGTCGRCGAAGPIGAVHVYRGAGIVLRCPNCGNTLAKIVKSDSRVWIDLTGIRTLEVAVDAPPPAKELAPLGERFRPYRSIIARYCWEAVALFRGGTDPSLR